MREKVGRKKKHKKREEKWGMKEKNERKGGKEKIEQKKEKKEGGTWIYGGRGAWVLRRAGPHTNNARLT